MAQIVIPNGSEFGMAEVNGIGSAVASPINIELTDSYGQLKRLQHGGGLLHA